MTEAQNSISIVLVTGMMVGTVFTLFVVPAFYSLIAEKHVAHAATEEPRHGLGATPAIA